MGNKAPKVRERALIYLTPLTTDEVNSSSELEECGVFSRSRLPEELWLLITDVDVFALCPQRPKTSSGYVADTYL